jgi:hypothetical protein
MVLHPQPARSVHSLQTDNTTHNDCTVHASRIVEMVIPLDHVSGVLIAVKPPPPELNVDG